MSGDDNLPVILVSAVNAAAASEIISELVKEDSSPSQCNGVDSESSHGVVWQLSNKYYSAAVRLLPLVDGAAPAPALDVQQAHLIYLTEDECGDTAACSRRATAAAAAAAARGVRLLAAPRESAALAAWAAARRYELVALRPEPAAEAEAEHEHDEHAAGGVARLREALHAHPWPGLRLHRHEHGAAPHADSGPSSPSSASSSGSWGSWAGAEPEPDAAEAVRRAELFADALALLPARRQLRLEDDAARRLHAEQLVAAFCRALGGRGREDGRQ